MNSIPFFFTTDHAFLSGDCADILALSAVQKLHFGYIYRKEFAWRCKEQ